MEKFQEEFLDKVGSNEIIEISQILDRVNKQQKLVEVVYYALLTMKGSKDIVKIIRITGEQVELAMAA